MNPSDHTCRDGFDGNQHPPDNVAQSGVEAAERDIAVGVLRYKWVGHCGPGGKEFCRLVHERFGMIVDDFGVCMVAQDKIAFARAYNATVRDCLIAAHGRDVVEEAFLEGRAWSQDRYDRYLASLKRDRRTK